MTTKADVMKQLERIPDDEPLFLLRAQDMTFVKAVGAWVGEALSLGCPLHKAEDAMELQLVAMRWQRVNPSRVKVPD